MLKHSDKIMFGVAGAIILIAGAITYNNYQKSQPLSWEECHKIPGAIDELSYPRVCVTPDGRRVAEPLTSEERNKVQQSGQMMNWKMYKNSNYKFQLNYPQEWDTYEHINNSSEVKSTSIYFGPSMDKKSIDEGGTGSGANILSISIYNQQYPTSVLQKTGEDKRGYLSGSKYEQIKFAGLKAMKVFTIYSDVPTVSNSYINFNQNNFGWNISYPNNNFKGEHNLIFDQILSTFKFLASSPDNTKDGCMVSGCSEQLCIPTSQQGNIMTICEYLEKYICYKAATCEKQTNGQCGWTQTDQLKSCLNKYSAQ